VMGEHWKLHKALPIYREGLRLAVVQVCQGRQKLPFYALVVPCWAWHSNCTASRRSECRCRWRQFMSQPSRRKKGQEHPIESATKSGSRVAVSIGSIAIRTIRLPSWAQLRSACRITSQEWEGIPGHASKGWWLTTRHWREFSRACWIHSSSLA